jgi:hypothetical protein
MYSPDAFRKAAEELAALNQISREEAGRILADIGDTVPIEEDGTVHYNGRILIWPFEE